MKCRWYRFLINRALDDGRPLPAHVERHLTDCTACRDEWKRQRAVLARLGGEAASVGVGGPSPFLRARILNQIGNERRVAGSAGILRWAWAAAGGACLVLLIGWLMRPAPQPDLAKALPVRGAGEPATLNSLALLASTARFTSGGEWLQVSTNLDQPLQREMDLVIDDARAVLRSLTTNLVPAQLLARGD